MIEHSKYEPLDVPFEQNIAFLNPAYPQHTDATKLRVFCRIARILLGMDDVMTVANEQGRAETVMQMWLDNYKTGRTLGQHISKVQIVNPVNCQLLFDDAGRVKIPKDTLTWQEIGDVGRNMLLELRYNDNVIYLDVFVGGRLAQVLTVNGWHFNDAAHKIMREHAQVMDDSGGFWEKGSAAA